MESDKENKRRRPWLVCVLLPLMVVCVLCSAQAGFLLVQPGKLDRNIRPFATADYSPWSFVRFQPVNPQLETLIIREESGEGASVAVLATPTAALSPTPIPVTPTPIPTNTQRPTSTQVPSPIPTNTLRPSATLTLRPTQTATLAPSRTATASITAVPTLTRTATASITAVPTLTRTSTPLPTATPLPTNTPLPTSTPLPTATPLPTNTPVPPPTDTPVVIPPTDTPVVIPPTDIPTATPTPFTLLQLLTMCSPDPASARVWVVQNPNPFPVNFDWALVSGSDSGSGTVPAAVGATPGEILFSSVTEAGLNTMNLFANGGILQDTENSDPTACSSVPCTLATIEIGSGDGDYCSLADGSSLVVTLSPAITADGNTADYELVFYEHFNGGSIYIDWVIFEVSTDGVTWFTIFNFGDGIDDTNTALFPTYAGSGEPDNYGVPAIPPLYGSPWQTGVLIDVDALVPPGTYPFLRVTSVGGGTGEDAEIDALEVLP